MADQQSKSWHLITFHFENFCEHWFSCETRTSVCLDGGLDGWWCVEKRVARTLRVFLSKNPFPATARPTGPNVAVGARTYSLVRILQLFSLSTTEHVQSSPIVHCFCIILMFLWKHTSLQIRRESASLSCTIKFLWWLWCSYHLQTRGLGLGEIGPEDPNFKIKTWPLGF